MQRKNVASNKFTKEKVYKIDIKDFAKSAKLILGSLRLSKSSE